MSNVNYYAPLDSDNDTLMTDPKTDSDSDDDMKTVIVFNCLYTWTVPTMCAGEGVLISQSRRTHAPVTTIQDPSHAPIRALDSLATHTGHNIS